MLWWYDDIWGFQYNRKWGYPIAGSVLLENPTKIWMITGGTPMTQETTIWWLTLSQYSSGCPKISGFQSLLGTASWCRVGPARLTFWKLRCWLWSLYEGQFTRKISYFMRKSMVSCASGLDSTMKPSAVGGYWQLLTMNVVNPGFHIHHAQIISMGPWWTMCCTDPPQTVELDVPHEIIRSLLVNLICNCH